MGGGVKKCVGGDLGGVGNVGGGVEKCIGVWGR